MPFARASELDRLLMCSGSAVLRRDETKTDAAYKAAQWGTICHAWKETGGLPDSARQAKLLAEKISASGIDREALWPSDGEHEVAVALNVVTGRAVRCAHPIGATTTYRDDWKRAFDDHWCVGTLDYVRVLLGRPWVDDLKTGRSGSPKDYECQQAFYCLALSIAEFGRVDDCRSTITHWPMYPKTVAPVRRGGVFSGDFLRDYYRRLQRLRDEILFAREDSTKLMPNLFMGDHCRYCPSRSYCPKFQNNEKEENDNG